MKSKHNDYSIKYVKYKQKYIKLKNTQKQDGGEIMTAAFMTAAASAVAAKRYLQCPNDDISTRESRTGLLTKVGKDDIRKKIRNALNYPEIKQDIKFKPILNKLSTINLDPRDINSNKFIPSNISLVELKNTLQGMSIDTSSMSKAATDVARAALTMTGFTNAKSKKQMNIDEIISFLDCGCNERGVTASGIVSQGIQSMFGSKTGGKVDLRCLLGLTPNLPLPPGDKPLFNFSENNMSCDPNDQNCEQCQKNVIFDTELLDNNTAIITALYPPGMNCLQDKIKLESKLK